MNNRKVISEFKRLTLCAWVMGLVLLMSMSVFALTTTDTNYSSGVYNWSFEYGTGIGASSGSYIGDRNYGWIRAGTGTFGVNYMGFDNTKAHTGNQSMKMDVNTLDNGESAFFNNAGYPNSTINLSTSIGGWAYLVKIKPSTNYKLSFWGDINKLEYTQLTGTKKLVAECLLTQYNSSNTRLNNTTIITRISQTTGGNFAYSNVLGQTVSTADYGIISCGFTGDTASGTFSDGNAIGWFDDVRLEEVGTTTLTSQVTGRPSITVTGVSDYNAIDQADTNNSNLGRIGELSTANKYVCQSFTPTQNKFTGIVFQRSTSDTIAIGDMNIYLTDNNGTNPSSTRLIEKNYSNAQWLALPIGTDVKIDLPYTLDANGTNKYWFCFESSTQSDTNYFVLRSSLTNDYSGGVRKRSADYASWTDPGNDLYFKTLFEKQSSAFDLNVCSQGDSVCESKTYDYNFLGNGSTYTITPSNAPLFHQGDNNVYYMQHSDSNYQNTTPSMMAKLNYTFDHPNTTITNTLTNNPQEQQITYNCTPTSFSPTCHTTITADGTTPTTNPFLINGLGTHTLNYFSKDDLNNQSTTTLTIITITGLQSFNSPSCGMFNLIPFILAASLCISFITGFLAFKKTDELNAEVLITSVVTFFCVLFMLIIIGTLVGLVCA